MAKLFLEGENLKALEDRYKKGGEGHGHFKIYLAEVIWEYFRDFREKRAYYEKNQDEVREILQRGASKAKDIAGIIASPALNRLLGFPTATSYK